MDLSETPLQNQTSKAEYLVKPGEIIEVDELQRRLDNLLKQDSHIRERRGKSYDLRGRIESLKVAETGDERPVIKMGLSLSAGEIGRPDEVLSALNLDPLSASIHRTEIILADEISVR